jgi:hypothetical protein
MIFDDLGAYVLGIKDDFTINLNDDAGPPSLD